MEVFVTRGVRRWWAPLSFEFFSPIPDVTFTF